MRKDAGAASLTARIVLQGADKMQQECIISVLLRRQKIRIPSIVDVALPGIPEPILHRERGIGNADIKGFKMGGGLELRVVQRVSYLDLGVENAVEKHVQFRERGCRGVLLLPANAQILARGFAERAKEKRTRATGWIVYRIGRPFKLAHIQNHRDDSAHFGWRVELPFGLATFSGKVLHQVFVCVSKQVIIGGTIFGKVKRIRLKHANQLREGLDHRLPLTELRRVVEVWQGQIADDTAVGLLYGFKPLVNLLTDVRVLFQGDKIVEPASLGDAQPRLVLFRLVRKILHEEHHQHVVLVLTCVHRAAKRVARVPEGAVELRFLECHFLISVTNSARDTCRDCKSAPRYVRGGDPSVLPGTGKRPWNWNRAS